MKKRARCQQRTLFLHFYRGYEKCFFNYEKLLLFICCSSQFFSEQSLKCGLNRRCSG